MRGEEGDDTAIGVCDGEPWRRVFRTVRRVLGRRGMLRGRLLVPLSVGAKFIESAWPNFPKTGHLLLFC